MKKMSKNDKRAEKYGFKPIKEFSPVSPYFNLLLRPRTMASAWKFIVTIIKDFFLLQDIQKFHLTHRPVIYVDTDIDDKIPFVPHRVKAYLGFIPFFVRPLGMMIKRLGYKKASTYINYFLEFISYEYKNAASIYRFCMSTTHRPDYNEMPEFKTIHIFDPHLLCVPSLHVTIAAGTWAWYRQCFALGVLPQDEAVFRLSEFKDNAIAIIESVLFVKQHSVNCIPLAMYMLSATMGKSFFSIDDAMRCMDQIFASAPEIDASLKKEISDYFKFMYERAILEKYYTKNWQDCIKHWLIEHAKETNQKI